MVSKKDEPKEQENKELELLRSENKTLSETNESLGQQNQGLKNLILQLETIIGTANGLSAKTVNYIKTNNELLAGLNLQELVALLDSNHKALSEITKEWKKE